MEETSGKMKLILTSRKVLVRVEQVEDRFMTWDGQVRVNRRRVKVYDYLFDEAQSQALREARELASKSGMALEVTDLTRQGLLRRLLRSGLRTAGGRGSALVVASSPPDVPGESSQGRPQAFRP